MAENQWNNIQCDNSNTDNIIDSNNNENNYIYVATL